jgi:hypothetical protein
MADTFITDISQLKDKSVIEANAKSWGVTPEEYLKSRGGVNASGYYGDSYDPNTKLSDAEYAAAKAGKTGVDQGSAINIATAKKAYDYALSTAKTDEEKATAKANYDAAILGNAKANPKAFGTINADGTTNTGAVIKYDANGKPIVTDTNPISSDTRDAFASLTNLFKSYGLDSLAGEISGYMASGLTASEALIKLKTNPSGAYAKRFAGNFTRVKNGLNVISEAEYIDLENSYANTLKAYGLGNMVSGNRDDNYKKFAEYIAGDISAVEFKDRIDTVQERVVNADPATKELFKKWYPSLTDKDLVAYFLNPTETIGKLKEKVTASEIGAAFTGQGLSTDMMSATDLARYGIDRAGALLGASQIAGVLPETTKLGNVYEEAGIDYTQKTGEEEFLKSNEAAKRKRTGLASLERGSFSASSGNAPGAYSTGYLKKSSTAGLI